MKKTKIISALLLTTFIAGCSNGKDPINPIPPKQNGIGPEQFVAREKQEMPTAQIIDKDFDYGNSSSWAGTEYTSKDLGKVYMQDIIDDTVYDHGNSVIKDGDTYKMWWVRPSSYDCIMYGESKDLKNWYNIERVIDFSPNANTIIKTKEIKGMLATPTVIKVDNVYYMYFEAPASDDPDPTQMVLEWDNQVFLATSNDGIEWNVYSDKDGEPIPVIAMQKEHKGDFTLKNYGYGQPNCFYKDGEFYLTYCNVMYRPELIGDNGIYLAKSSDPFNFGPVSTHTKIAYTNGWGFTYNTKTNKFMATNGTVMENDTMDFINPTQYKIHYIDESSILLASFDFVKNPQGLVDTETIYVMHQYGPKSTTADHRATHTMWDLHLQMIKPREYQNREFTLPNGAAATENNLREYDDRINTYSAQNATASYVEEGNIIFDGNYDEIYDESSLIDISRPIYNWGSNFTTSHAYAKVAYNEKYLYVFARVYDETPNTSYAILSDGGAYQHDGLDIFIDVPNDHGDTY